MFGFIKRLFQSKENNEGRTLSHPCDLRQGDFVKFQFLPQPEVCGNLFEVNKVNTYRYDGVEYPEMILKDGKGNIIFMMIEEEDGEEYIGLSKKVPTAMIRNIIPQTSLDSILQEGTGLRLQISQKPEGFEPWLANSYTETDEYRGIFSKGDGRSGQKGADEHFKSHHLTDPSDEYALEIEVYGTGEIELSTTVYHDINVIDEILPGSLEEQS